MSLVNSAEPHDDSDYTASSAAPPPFWTRYGTLLILLAILVVAAFFRFSGRDFDQGTSQHPDEIAIVGATLGLNMPASVDQIWDPQNSPLNLRSGGKRYPWGALPVYIARSAAWVADVVAPAFNPRYTKGYYLAEYTGAQMVGRTMASIFDLLSVVLVFLIARRLYSARAALIAAALVALAVTHIQIAHFYITEPFMVVFMLSALYFSVRLMQRPTWWAATFAGLFIGLSVASKVTSALIFAMVIAAVLLRAAYRRRSRTLGAEMGDPVGVRPASHRERDMSFGRHAQRGLLLVIIAAIFSVVGFAIAEPYVLWQFDFANWRGPNLQESFRSFFEANPWGKVVLEEAATQGGQADLPYTRQYIGTVPVLYQFEQFLFWGVGVVPGLIMLAGLVVAFWMAFKRRPAEVILLSFGIPYFLTILLGETKWMRYMLPLVPIFAILAAGMLVRGGDWAKARWPRRAGDRGLSVRALQRGLFPSLTALAILFAFLWSVAFYNIYTKDHTRVRAGQWASNNIPPGSTISFESWDRDLPFLSGVRTGGEYEFKLYDDRPIQDEFLYITDMLDKLDYIGITSNRLYGSIPRLPWRYPVQTQFYQLLYAEKLGFVLEHTEQTMPEIFGMQFDDQLADESFSVYDHPRVDIFRKVTTLTDDQLRTLFATSLNFPLEEYSPQRHGEVLGDRSLMLQDPIRDQPEVGDYAWNPLAQEDTQWFGVALWLLAIYLLGFAALPLTFTVFRRLPDRGYAFAKLAGLLIVSWIVWMLASGRLVPFTVWSVWLAVGVLSALSLLVWKLGAREEMRDFFRRKRSLVLFYEGLFLLTFVFMLVIRMLNPDAWHTIFGGEKTMELGFLNSTLRSPWMPPADPFFAGGYVNYYYQGQFIIACLIKLVGIDPAIAFNLGLTVIYSLTFVAAASVVYNIVAWSRARRGSARDVSRTAMAFGTLGGVLMLVIGNLSTIVQFIWVVFPTSSSTLLQWGRNLGLSTEGFTSVRPQFYFWPPSRVIPDTINEFPYWSFLYGDLHPHLIDMPFTVMVVALGLNLVLAGRYIFSHSDHGLSRFDQLRTRASSAFQWLWGRGGVGALTFAFTALALGVLFVTNSWDFPSYAGLLGGIVFVAMLLSRKVPLVDADGRELAESTQDDRPLGARGAVTFTLATFASLGAMALLAVLAYVPFFLNFKAFYTSIMPLIDGGLIPGTGTIMRRTAIWEFIAVWGIFLFVIISYLAMRLWCFPWRAALADLLGVVPASRQTRPEIVQSPSPAGAIVYEEPAPRTGTLLPLRRQRRLALAPAFATSTPGEVSTDVLFRTETPADDAAQTAPNDGQVASNRVEEHEVLPEEPVEQSGNSNGEPRGEPLNWLSLGPDVQPESAYRDPIDTDASSEAAQVLIQDGQRDAGSQMAPVIPNWVAVAHLEDLRQREVVASPARYQPGVIPLWLGLAILAGTAAVTALQIATGQFTLALLVALIGGITGTLLSTTRSAAALAGGVILVVGLVVAMGVELVYLADFMSSSSFYRQNTVFKFYIQVWQLLAMGCAVAVYYLLYGLRDQASIVNKEEDEPVLFSPSREYGVLAVAPETFEASTPYVADATDSRPYVANGQDSGPDTAPLSTGPLTTNWLVWSTEEIASTSLPTGHLPDLADDVQPAAGTSVIDIEENVPPLITRPRHERSTDGTPEGGFDLTPTVRATERAEDLLRIRWKTGRVVWAVFACLFLLIGFIFPLYGTPDKLSNRIQPNTPIGTLSGLAYMQNATFTHETVPFPIQMKYDYQGIKWLNNEVKGLATIAELPVGYYREGGMRIASNTGLPMVIGSQHEGEQRDKIYQRLIGDRQNDMRELFTTPDIQRALTIISKYDIDYIYLGQHEVGFIQLEGQRGNISASAALNKFEQMAEPDVRIIEKVFETDTPANVVGTTIYRVTRQEDRDPRTLVGAPVEGSGLPGISITPLPTSTPLPPPTPPTNDPTLLGLIEDVTRNPTSREVRMRLVDWYAENGYPLEAAKELGVLIQQNPLDVALYHRQGDMYVLAGMDDEALKAWEDARDIAPDVPDTHNKVGIAYLERRRFDDAIREFEAAVQINAGFTESWFHMGQAYERKGDREGAVRAYQSAVDNAREPNGWQTAAQERLDVLR